ncbi:MAG: methyltransferase domain-containing protein [Terriglobales bacterium]
MRLRLQPELLDEDRGTAAEIAASLADLSWIHAHLGGETSWRQLLAAWMEQEPLPPQVYWLDVGAGTGAVTRSIAAALAEGGHAVHAWALDRSPRHLRPDLCPGLAADAFRLPFAARTWDVVSCNLFLHHFHDRPGLPAATRLIEEMVRVARRVVLINDLERAWPPYLAIRALAPRFSRLTRHDGPCSVRQAYTAEELERLAGSRPHRLLKLSHYRLGLIVGCPLGL